MRRLSKVPEFWVSSLVVVVHFGKVQSGIFKLEILPDKCDILPAERCTRDHLRGRIGGHVACRWKDSFFSTKVAVNRSQGQITALLMPGPDANLRHLRLPLLVARNISIRVWSVWRKIGQSQTVVPLRVAKSINASTRADLALLYWRSSGHSSLTKVSIAHIVSQNAELYGISCSQCAQRGSYSKLKRTCYRAWCWRV